MDQIVTSQHGLATKKYVHQVKGEIYYAFLNHGAKLNYRVTSGQYGSADKLGTRLLTQRIKITTKLHNDHYTELPALLRVLVPGREDPITLAVKNQ